MTGFIKTIKAYDDQGLHVQFSLFDTGYSFEIHCWQEATQRDRLLETLDYQGFEDRRATRSMAMGTLHGMRDQAAEQGGCEIS